MENPAPHGQTHEKPVFFRKWEGLLVAALLLGAAVWLAFSLWGRAGAVARVTVGTGDATATESIPLNRDGLYAIEGALPVTLEVRDGAIRFVDSVCPDHDCEGFGWLSREGEWALCAPAEVMVRIEENPA